MKLVNYDAVLTIKHTKCILQIDETFFPQFIVSKFTYLLLHLSTHLPVRVCPCLTRTGVSTRHLTWYQWVRVSVGAVDNHTDSL